MVDTVVLTERAAGAVVVVVVDSRVGDTVVDRADVVDERRAGAETVVRCVASGVDRAAAVAGTAVDARIVAGTAAGFAVTGESTDDGAVTTVVVVAPVVVAVVAVVAVVMVDTVVGLELSGLGDEAVDPGAAIVVDDAVSATEVVVDESIGSAAVIDPPPPAEQLEAATSAARQRSVAPMVALVRTGLLSAPTYLD